MSEELKNKATTEGDAVTDIAIPNDLKEKLVEYGADDATMKKIFCDLGVESLDDLTSMEVEDLVGAGMKLAKARKLLTTMKTSAKPAAATVPSAVESIESGIPRYALRRSVTKSKRSAFKIGFLISYFDMIGLACCRNSV